MSDRTFVNLLNAFENAAMAYERLGSMKRDDSKTRQIRIDTMAGLAEARSAIFRYVTETKFEESHAVVEERDRCRRIAKHHSHHALWVGLPDVPPTDTFGIALAQRIEAAILEEPNLKLDPSAQQDLHMDLLRGYGQ